MPLQRGSWDYQERPATSSPTSAPYAVEINGLAVIGHAPVRHPMRRWYEYPSTAPTSPESTIRNMFDFPLWPLWLEATRTPTIKTAAAIAGAARSRS